MKYDEAVCDVFSNRFMITWERIIMLAIFDNLCQGYLIG